ncbi:hypothetical protein MHF_1413 [Mycoplasma haemofelis Ohio2]|uniref:Uncharacterized protein n=1 Tax=Mycoplasma haemofelis (strain Ohio2) TaxID=859194 RepID=F6FGK9_MYCHI|nr:hypothetical protein MHF_1413 [Mycoplasma haemofelis Ohio2]
MDSLTTKGLIGLGGLSVAGGGGALAWQQGLLSGKSETIRDKLEKEGYEVLGKTSEHWSKIFDVYKGDGNTKKFKNDQITSSSSTADHDKLKQQCENSLDLESSKKEDYEKVIKWCVVPRKVEDLIPKSSLLNVTTDSNDASSWKPILTEYAATKSTSGSSNTYELSGVTLTEPSNASNDSTNINALKTGCKARREKLTYQLDFESSLGEVKKWCTAR